MNFNKPNEMGKLLQNAMKQEQNEFKSKLIDNLDWANTQNSIIFRGVSQPIDYMKTLGFNISELIDDLQELSKEQLITMIVNFNIMQDDIIDLINDETEKE